MVEVLGTWFDMFYNQVLHILKLKSVLEIKNICGDIFENHRKLDKTSCSDCFHWVEPQPSSSATQWFNQNMRFYQVF
jgi:hypothetical protein